MSWTPLKEVQQSSFSEAYSNNLKGRKILAKIKMMTRTGYVKFFFQKLDKLLIDVGISKCRLIEVHVVIFKKPHNGCENFKLFLYTESRDISIIW